MKNQTTLALAVIITAFISSCAPAIYSPITEVVPTIEQQGDLIIKGAVSFSNPGVSLFTNGEQTAGQLSATYGLSEKVGAHAEYSRSLSNRDKRKTFSLGIGHLKQLSEHSRFQIYLNAGKGMMDYDSENDFLNIDKSADFVFASLQPKYSVLNKNFEIYMATNFKNMRYSHIEGTSAEERNTNRILIEPSAGMVIRLNDVQLHSNFGISYDSDIELEGYYMGFGVSKTI